MLYNYMVPGGVRYDIPKDNWVADVLDFIDLMEYNKLPEYNTLLTYNKIFILIVNGIYNQSRHP